MSPLVACLALSACALCVFTDLRRGLIPNWLTLPLMLLGLILATLQGGVGGLLLALLGALLCAMPGWFLFGRGALGGGDLKLFAALGALCGTSAGLELQLLAFALVAVGGLLRAAWQGHIWQLFMGSLRASLHLLAPKRFAAPPSVPGGGSVAMGPAIFLACLVVVGSRAALLQGWAL